MRILGIDPGLAIVGYAVLDFQDSENFNIVTTGSIQTSKNLDNKARLLEIHNDLETLIKQYKPDMASIEELFYFKNLKTVMPVSEARGVILMTFAKHKINVFEYTPLQVKMNITGYGRSTKKDVQEMTAIICKGEKLPKLDDTVDAIAIALCHIRTSF